MRPIALRMSTDMVRDVQNIPRALRAAGFRLEDAPFLVWRTNVVTKWPGSANEELRAYPHPGVAAELVVGRSGDTTVVLGTVVSVCAGPAGVPDSVGRIAAELAGDRILDELEKRR
jgi:hypothetical protein